MNCSEAIYAYPECSYTTENVSRGSRHVSTAPNRKIFAFSQSLS